VWTLSAKGVVSENVWGGDEREIYDFLDMILVFWWELEVESKQIFISTRVKGTEE
jgi:hypothetical protein